MAIQPITVREVAEWLGGEVEGDPSARVWGLASLEAAGPADLSFAADEKRVARLPQSKAAAVLVPAGSAAKPAPGTALIRVKNVQAAVAKLLSRLAEPEDVPPPGVHPSAAIAPDAQVGQGVAIGPGVSIGARSRVGDGTVLYAHVSIGADAAVGRSCFLAEGVVIRQGCVAGDRVRIGPNSVIGWDGFGYFSENGVHHRIQHIGNVVIEDDVEIGACSCVDRAKFGSTRIGAGTKIDNLVQVAHNVQIGRGCILVGQCGIAGSAQLGNYVVIGGNAGIRDNISLGDGVQCSAFAAVAQDVAAGQVVVGVPARPAREALRIVMAEEKLPDLLKRVKELESRLAALESPKDH
jgi:UDP-3-O-[3-hydroxymyristoyl] glucosamine N-acyltransferase